MLLGILLLTSLLIAPEASPWGSAIHAYIDDHLGKNGPFRNVNEMHGGAAPDVFNTMFDRKAWMDFLYGETRNNFMKVWEAAYLQMGKAAAFGFASHNDVWGADSTAHHRCARTQCADGDGYVVAKAKEMLQLPELTYSLYFHLQLPYPVALELSHNIVESALDPLIWRNDPAIGKTLATATLLRAPQFPLLVVEAFAHDFSHQFGMRPSEAIKVILEAEINFRKTAILYGQVLTQDDATATQLVAEQLAAQAVGFLGSFGLDL